MIVRFDKLDRLEVPKLTLCNPGSTYSNGILTNVVGVLTDTEAEEIVFNFNATSELNFRINKVKKENAEDTEISYNLYRAVQNRRLIFVDDIGFFSISNVVDGYDELVHYKDVTAQSIDIELAQKGIPYIANGTYVLYSDDEGEHGILNNIMAQLPLWTINHIDSNLETKYRTFEDVDVSLNCLSFLIENIQDAYECIVVFDIINREISIYDESNYIQDTNHNTNIHITKDDFIHSLSITENSEDVYTAIYVRGGDEGISIAAVNPLQTNTIYNFDHYLDWMTPILKAKVIAWESAVLNAEEVYYSRSHDLYQQLAVSEICKANIDRLNIQISMYDRCRENITALDNTDIVASYNKAIKNAGGKDSDCITIGQEVEETKQNIATLKASCLSERDEWITENNTALSEVESKRAELSAISSPLAFENYFTNSELAELDNYIFEGEYTDEYIIITDIMSLDEKFDQMKILYDRAKVQLSKISIPTQEFEVDVDNFVFEKDFKDWSAQLETGCLINAELSDNDVAKLFLSTISINYDDHDLSLKFGNRFNKFDPKSLFDDVLGSVNRSANSVSYLKDLTTPIKNGEIDRMQEEIQNSRNITMGGALSSQNETVVIDESGYTGKSYLGIDSDIGTPSYDDRQIKIVSKNIVFTDDNWDTCKTAIGEVQTPDGNTLYGINGEVIIGDVIIGNNLNIKCTDEYGGTSALLDVVDGKITSQVTAVKDEIDSELDDRLSEYTTIEQLQNEIKLNVKSVTTDMGYTFNDSGLHIKKEDNDIGSTLDNQGLKVTKDYIKDGQRVEETILSANIDGVIANNLTSKQFLTIGNNCRFEDFDVVTTEQVDGVTTTTTDHRTGCFYIGLGSVVS